MSADGFEPGDAPAPDAQLADSIAAFDDDGTFVLHDEHATAGEDYREVWVECEQPVDLEVWR